MEGGIFQDGFWRIRWRLRWFLGNTQRARDFRTMLETARATTYLLIAL